MRLLMPLFSPTTGTWGGLTRALAVAEAARVAGHEIAFCASGYVESTLRQRDYRVFPLPSPTMFGLPGPVSRLLERRSQRATIPIPPGRSFGSLWFIYLLTGMAQPAYLRRLLTAEIMAAHAFWPDVLFTDVDPGAYLLSYVTGLPLASAYADIARKGHGSLAWRLMDRAIRGVLKDNGKPSLAPDDLCFGRTVLKIIPSIPELDGTDPARQDVCYVGQMLGEIQPANSQDFQPEAGRRYVFVYLGTGSISLPAMRRVLPKVFPTQGSLRCLVGCQSIEQPEKIGGVEFRPYWPAELILPHCDWVICHGGQNTIVQSLRRDVPLIIFPGPIFERRFNARKVAEARAGLMVELPDFTVSWLNAALTKRSECATGAAALGAKIRSYGGAGAAVAAIASWLASRPGQRTEPA